MAQQTAVEWLADQVHTDGLYSFKKLFEKEIEQAKQMEKEQSIDLIKQTAMFMAASTMDKEIGDMNFEDVYNSYFKK